IQVLECPRPFRVVKIRIHPALRNRIMDCETMLAAGWQVCQTVDAPAEVRGVVDVAVLDHIVGMLQRRDVERLRLPRAVRHGAIRKLRDKYSVAVMPGGDLE